MGGHTVFRAMSDPVKYEILKYLCTEVVVSVQDPTQPKSKQHKQIPLVPVTRLMDEISQELSQAQMSYHLKILKEAGLVDYVQRNRSREHYYYCCEPEAVRAMFSIATTVSETYGKEAS